MRSRRALLYMPAHEMRKIEKAAGLGVDCVCMDLEDSVPAGEKEAARRTAAEALRTLDFGTSERLVLNLPAICAADSRLEALIFGAEDLAADIGATRTAAGTEILYARSAVVLHAAAFNLQALDMVHVNFRDPEATYREALAGAEMGFTGKQVIHPAQVEPVQRAFTPDDETIRKAQALLADYEQHTGQGRGAFATKSGDMVDAPVIKMAENVLVRARAAGKIS